MQKNYVEGPLRYWEKFSAHGEIRWRIPEGDLLRNSNLSLNLTELASDGTLYEDWNSRCSVWPVKAMSMG